MAKDLNLLNLNHDVDTSLVCNTSLYRKLDVPLLSEPGVDGVPPERGVLGARPVEPRLRPPQHDVGVHGHAEVDVVHGGDVLHPEFDVHPRRLSRHLFNVRSGRLTAGVYDHPFSRFFRCLIPIFR